MPLGWWAFIDESASEDATVITDPYHSDRKFVTITQSFLCAQINRFVSKDIKVLLDIHAFPGGSAEGSLLQRHLPQPAQVLLAGRTSTRGA